MVESLIPTVVDKLNFVLRDFSGAEVSELTRLLTKFIAVFDCASGGKSGVAA
jgi:hypothetical protein